MKLKSSYYPSRPQANTPHERAAQFNEWAAHIHHATRQEASAAIRLAAACGGGVTVDSEGIKIYLP